MRRELDGRAFLGAAGAAMLGGCRRGHGDKRLVLRLSHSMAAGPTALHVLADRFREEVDAATGGEVRIAVFPSGTLGHEREVVQQLQEGLVDFMVGLKLNLLMLYTEHVFRFRRHPLIGKGASPMAASELRELDLYARQRHVELVPTLQSLGHMHQILKYPRYEKLAESEKKWSLSPALEETYALLDDLYAEYVPNFSSPWLNANCDEPFDLEPQQRF